MFPTQILKCLSIRVCALTLLAAGSCDTSMSDVAPGGQPIPGSQGPQGPVGPQGPAGANGTNGTNADIMAGDGIDFTADTVSLDTMFTDGRYWKQGGNANADPSTQFLGTIDSQPMELRVDNQRAVRLARAMDGGNDSVNVIIGSSVNDVQGATSYGATISGGGYVTGAQSHGNIVTAKGGTISGGWDNQAGELGSIGGGAANSAARYGSVGGGYNNAAGSDHAAICGGSGNQANGLGGFVGGGQMNIVNGGQGAISGGTGNEAFALAAVGGGLNNKATALYSTVPGGFENQANAQYSFAAGYHARANNTNSFVWGDSGMTATQSFANNQFFVGTTGGAVLARTDQLNGFNTTTTNAAVMIEKLNDSGEALWIWQRKEQPDTIPVVKIHRNSNATNDNNYMEGWDWSGPGAMQILERKWRINKNGTYIAGGDFAESLPVVGKFKDYEPGDVLVLAVDLSGTVAKCRDAASSAVAGVYSTRPGVLGTETFGETRKDEIPVAIMGIVPTKVCTENGPIEPGDLLVTSSTVGHAMRARPVMIGNVAIYPTGAILGKALEALRQEKGKIRVLVSLR